MHLQVAQAGPAFPEAPRGNRDRMQQLYIKISGFTFMQLLNHKNVPMCIRKKLLYQLW